MTWQRLLKSFLVQDNNLPILVFIVSIMGVDVLATQVSRASATMILTISLRKLRAWRLNPLFTEHELLYPQLCTKLVIKRLRCQGAHVTLVAWWDLTGPCWALTWSKKLLSAMFRVSCTQIDANGQIECYDLKADINCKNNMPHN